MAATAAATASAAESNEQAGTGFVQTAGEIKLTLTPPDSSNRLEANLVQPLVKGGNSLLTFDNTIYAKTIPVDQIDDNKPFLQTWGESARLVYRQLSDSKDFYWGINAGYDSALQAGYYYQQAGIGAEAVFQGMAFTATANYPIGQPYFSSPGQAILSSATVQLSLPTGIPNISVAPRYYYVYNQLGVSSSGTQLQLSYGITPALSATLSGSVDNVSGYGSSLQFKYYLNLPSKANVPADIPYSIAAPMSQALGNNGSRIIRLTGSVPAYGD